MSLRGLKLDPCCFTMDERFVPEPINCLLLTFDEGSGRPTAAQIAAQLAAGKPSIAAIQEQNKLGFVMDVLEEDEVHAIEQAVKAVLARV
jgi:L-seryl-tRNA(Ser) seleniumtransferase